MARQPPPSRASSELRKTLSPPLASVVQTADQDRFEEEEDPEAGRAFEDEEAGEMEILAEPEDPRMSLERPSERVSFDQDRQQSKLFK